MSSLLTDCDPTLPTWNAASRRCGACSNTSKSDLVDNLAGHGPDTTPMRRARLVVSALVEPSARSLVTARRGVAEDRPARAPLKHGLNVRSSVGGNLDAHRDDVSVCSRERALGLCRPS